MRTLLTLLLQRTLPSVGLLLKKASLTSLTKDVQASLVPITIGIFPGSDLRHSKQNQQRIDPFHASALLLLASTDLFRNIKELR